MPTGSFVGRERELAALLDGLAGLSSRRGCLFVIAGEPGIGKTRLADELAARATASGATVAFGAAWEGGAPAYWPWIQLLRALRPLVPEPDERLRRDLGPMWGDDPGLAEPTEGARDLELLRFRRFDALRGVLEAASARAPLVIVLDDLHAADRASLLALQFVARSLRSVPILIVAAHRDAEARLDPSTCDLLSKIAREGRVLELSRFGRPEVARLLAALDPVSPELIDDVLKKSGGNPLFVEETLRVVRTGAPLSVTPDGVSAVIRDRLERFGPPARAALEAAAVLGAEIDLEVLSEVLGVSPTEARERSRGPRIAGVLEDAGGGRLRFSHGLFRERLIEDLSAERRGALHLRAGEVLARRRESEVVGAGGAAVGALGAGVVLAGASPGARATDESIALHFLAASPLGDPSNAADWAVRAGESAFTALAFDRAAALFEGALSALDRVESTASGEARDGEEDTAARTRRIDVSLRLAEALARSGAGDRGRAICSSAATLARSLGDGLRLARAALAYGSQLRVGVVDRTLVALLGEGLEALGETDQKLRARVLARLAAAQQPAADPQVPVEEAREAIALARATGDPETLLAVLYTAGSAMVDYAPPGERALLARELISLALPRGELTVAQQAYARLAIDSLELGDLAGADLAMAAHERLGEALGHPRWRWRAPLMRSMRALIEGRWADSDRERARAGALAAEADEPNFPITLSLHAIGALRAREAGDPRDLAALWDDGLDRLEFASAMSPLICAAVLGRLGDVEGARRAFAAVRFEPMLARDPMLVSLLCDGAVTTGDSSRIGELLAGLALLRGRTLTWGVLGLIWEGPAAQWSGGMLALSGRWAEAAAAFEEALAEAEILGARPLAARLRHELARARWKQAGAGARDRTEAVALLDAAGREAGELGMRHLLARIEVTRRELGVTTRGDEARGVEARGVEARGVEARGVEARARGPAKAPSTEPALTLTREGDIWSMAFAGRLTRLKHSRAIEILDQLVQNAGREIHVLDLCRAEPGEVIDAGDSGEALDAEAKSAYRRRIAELEEELHEAEGWADAGRSARLHAELGFLKEELARAVGLGGRDRRAGAAVERARVNVQKRLRGLIKKIGESLPELGSHLEAEVRTGTYVSYGARDPASHGP